MLLMMRPGSSLTTTTNSGQDRQTDSSIYLVAFVRSIDAYKSYTCNNFMSINLFTALYPFTAEYLFTALYPFTATWLS